MTSTSTSLRHSTKRSSSGIGLTKPPTSPRRSMVAVSITLECCSRYMTTAWHASCSAIECRSRST